MTRIGTWNDPDRNIYVICNDPLKVFHTFTMVLSLSDSLDTENVGIPDEFFMFTVPLS